MREFLRAALLATCLLLILVPVVTAHTVSSVVIDPPGSLVPGTPVIVTYTVDFTASGDERCPSRNELLESTDLEKAKWTYVLVLDGLEIPQPTANSGRFGTYPYPTMEDADGKMVTLEGIAPKVTQTSNKTLIKICDYDCHNNLVSKPCFERTTVVVNTCCIVFDSKISPLEDALQQFRADIENTATMGIDTATAEAKYTEAEQKIASARSRPSTWYLQKFSDLDAAKKAIADGEIALDRAWAEKEVADAQVPINNVDIIIAWFKANSSTAEDPQLPAIVAKREVAMSYISAANDHLSSGNYDEARMKAQEAYLKANETYTDALSSRRSVTCCGPDPFRHPLFRAGIAVIILIAIGIIWWKKFPKK